jgi:hypothetical protein
LPIYDEFLIAYQDRGFVERRSSPGAIPPTYGRGGFNHSVIVDGRLAGSWKRIDRGSACALTLATGKLSRSELGAVGAAVEQFETFVGRPVTLARA